jgi:hypothetical protein
MARSHQRGTVRPEGGSWVGFINVKLIDPRAGQEKRKKKRIDVLGSRSRMSKSQAREELDAQIAKQAGRGGAPNKDSRVTFGWFVHNRWYPLKEADWKPETARDKKCIIQKDLFDKFENIPLEEFDKFQLQVHLNNWRRRAPRTACSRSKPTCKGYLLRPPIRSFWRKTRPGT